MFRKLLSVLSISSILLVSSSLVFAQSVNDWSRLDDIVNQEVAIKTRNGMKYGIIKSVDPNSLILQVAGKKRMTQDEITVDQNDVKKIWRAILFVNSRNIGKGALIGAGVGAVGLGAPSTIAGARENDPLGAAGIFIGALGGAAVGGVIGFFAKNKHKKRDLIYKQ